ncbi:MAG: hypothetical protein QG556_456 [Pseudomonadota bacterium]|nr:hypothetical protein [Pseudomonadota bacterium]
MLSFKSSEKQPSTLMDYVLSYFKAIANWLMSFSSWFSCKRSEEKEVLAVNQVEKDNMFVKDAGEDQSKIRDMSYKGRLYSPEQVKTFHKSLISLSS